MPRPARFFVRVWTVDPRGEGPDDESNFSASSEREARAIAKKRRLEFNESAGAFERRNIHVPDDVPMVDPPEQFWEWDDVQIDEDEVDRELRRHR